MTPTVHTMAGNGLTVCGIDPMVRPVVNVGSWAINAYGEALPVVTCEKCRQHPRSAFPNPAKTHIDGGDGLTVCGLLLGVEVQDNVVCVGTWELQQSGDIGRVVTCDGCRDGKPAHRPGSFDALVGHTPNGPPHTPNGPPHTPDGPPHTPDESKTWRDRAPLL